MIASQWRNKLKSDVMQNWLNDFAILFILLVRAAQLVMINYEEFENYYTPHLFNDFL